MDIALLSAVDIGPLSFVDTKRENRENLEKNQNIPLTNTLFSNTIKQSNLHVFQSTLVTIAYFVILERRVHNESVKKKFFSIISVVLIFTLMITVNAGAALAAPQENTSIPDQNYYEENGVKVEIVHKSPENAVIYVDDKKHGENYSIDIHQNDDGSYYSKTVDENGTLLNTIVRVNDELIQYDANGNILSRNTVPKAQDINTISPFAGTWQDKIYVQSDIVTDLSNQVNVVSTIVTVLCSRLGIANLIGEAISIITGIANHMLINHIPTTYYKGWKQYGWEYAYYMVRYNLNFYEYSNYTGFIKNLAQTQGVH